MADGEVALIMRTLAENVKTYEQVVEVSYSVINCSDSILTPNRTASSLFDAARWRTSSSEFRSIPPEGVYQRHNC